MPEWTNGEGAERAPLAALRGFVRQRVPVERCELCGKGLGAEHSHLVRTERRQLVCACEPCALLFVGAGASAYKRVPRRITALNDFELSDEQWDALAIPIDLAFFLRSSTAGQVVAVYPSPAGPTESLLHLEAWDDIVAGHSAAGSDSKPTWRRCSSIASVIAGKTRHQDISSCRSTSATSSWA